MFPRLYAILDTDLAARLERDPLQILDAWLDAGVRLIQLRAKSMASGTMLTVAAAMASRVSAAGGIFIVNDRADVARLSGAAGLHLGQDDLTPAQARLLLPSPACIGLSTHTDAQVLDAIAQPIDYLAIGPAFPTSSKAQPDPVVGLAGIRAASARAAARGIPVVAIGGISLERAPQVIDAGATSVAVIADLLRGEPGERARAFLDALGS